MARRTTADYKLDLQAMRALDRHNALREESHRTGKSIFMMAYEIEREADLNFLETQKKIEGLLAASGLWDDAPAEGAAEQAARRERITQRTASPSPSRPAPGDSIGKK